MRASLSISSNCTQESVSGAPAGKENLALAQCRAPRKKNDCSKDKKITASSHLTFLERGEERLEG